MLHKQMPPVDKCLSRRRGKVEQGPGPGREEGKGRGGAAVFFPGKTAGYRMGRGEPPGGAKGG